jgi:16S rRNA (guanine527-N7)-methyltransferase
VPGLVLALGWTETSFCLLESATRRAELLEEAVTALGLGGRAAVVNARAEEAARDPSLRYAFEVVLARSFGRPGVTAECGAPFLRVGGRLVVSEPPRGSPQADATVSSTGTDAHAAGGAAGTPRWPVDACGQLGLKPTLAIGEPFAYQVLVQERLCPARYPRQVGRPSKRPLF